MEQRVQEQRCGSRIGPASYRFSVAPMLDYTDRHFRVLMRQITRHSLLYSEMVVAQALHHARREPGADKPGGRLERLIGFDPCERPLALQVGGDDPALLADAARLAADWGYDEINLNVGCPSEKVQQGRFGACLMADPERVARGVAAMAAAGPLPVTVKHRIGIDERDSYAELLAFVDTLAAAGCQLLLFTTGRGTPLGSCVPTVKISSTSRLYESKKNWFDFNVGQILDGLPVPESLTALKKCILDTASGLPTSAERSGYREIALFKRGVIL